MTGSPLRLRPLLFLDVDGPLIPFGATPEQYPDGYPTYMQREAALIRCWPGSTPRSGPG